MLQIILGAKKRRSADVSHLQLSPPTETQENVTLLISMGLHRLGETQLKLPFLPISTMWILIDSENKVEAETIKSRVSFISYFQNNVMVVTDYPNGEHIEMPTYQVHTITTGLKDAYQHHLQQIEKFSQRFGPPNLIHSMSDYLYWDAIGRAHYGGLKLRRNLWLPIILLISFGYGAIAIALLSILFLTNSALFGTSSMLAAENVELLIILLTLPAVVIPPILSRGLLKSKFRNLANP